MSTAAIAASLAGLVSLATFGPVLAQSAGGAGGDGSAGNNTGGVGGTLGTPGGNATGPQAGGGGGGPTATGTAQPGGAGNGVGTAGGAGGTNGFIAGDTAFSGTSAYAGTRGGDARRAASEGPVGAGGGGAGGYGAILSGTGAFATTAAIAGGSGGDGGSAVGGGYGYGYGYGYGASGGGGGDGGVGILVMDGTTFAAEAGARVVGGAGGIGGSSQNAPGGAGGTGGTGVLIANGSPFDNAGAVRGGAGGTTAFSFTGRSGKVGGGGTGVALLGGRMRNGGTIVGGTGGTADSAGLAGTGGTGVSAAGATLTNIVGGIVVGGTGGRARSEAATAGDGGTGIAATATTITNAGAIRGGAAGTSPFFAGAAGGVGILGSDLTVVTSGTIAGGLGGPDLAGPPTRNAAIRFTGGTNSLTLLSGYRFDGAVVAASPGDTLALGGTADATFAVGAIGAAGSGAPFRGFGLFAKTGTGVWTLSGTTDVDTAWRIGGGTLSIAADANLGGAASTLPAAVTLDGGILRTTGSFASARGMVIGPGGGAIEPTAGTLLTLNGAVSGDGRLTKTGAGTLTLLGPNTYGGGTMIAAGTLAVGTGTALGSGPVAVNDATLAFVADGLAIGNAIRLNTAASTLATGNNDATLSGVVSGPGALGKSGAGTLTLSAANTFAGGTDLRGGTLAVGDARALGTGALRMDENTTLRFAADNLTLANAIAFTGALDPTVDTGANAATLSGVIAGPGALTKLGSGTLRLTADNTYTGATNIVGGTLVVDGAVARSTVTVNNGTALGGSGTVGGIVARPGGTIAPGTAVPYGTLSVAGPVTFAGGSTYRVAVDPTGRTDAIAATGPATLDGGTVAVVAAPGFYTAGTRYTILTAAGGRTGTFDALTTSSTLAFLSPTLSYDPTRVFLGFAQNGVAFPAVGTTPNQQAAAGAIQALGPNNPLYDAVLPQTIPGAQQAFDATSGEAHASSSTAAILDARFVSTAIIDRLWNIGGAGLDAYQVLQGFGPTTLPTLLRCYAPNDTVTPAILSSYSVWGQGIGAFGRNDRTADTAALDRTLGGFIFGVDVPVYGVLADVWRFGVAGGYSNDGFDVGRRGSAGTFESVFGSLYGGARFGAVDLRFGAGYGGNSTNLRRTVAFPGFFETERSSTDGDTVQGFAEIGYRFAFGRSVLEPIAGFTAVHVHQDGFRERGGAAALVGFGRDTDQQTTTLGFRGEATPFATLPIVARLFLGWQHAFGDIRPDAVVAFAGGGPAFTVEGAPIDRDAVVTQAGLDYRATDTLTLGASYSGQAGSHAYENAVRGRFEYKF